MPECTNGIPGCVPFPVTPIPAGRDNEGMKAGALNNGHGRAFIYVITINPQKTSWAE